MTFKLMIEISMKNNFAFVPILEIPVLNNSILPLEYMPCIYYLLCFRKDQVKL